MPFNEQLMPEPIVSGTFGSVATNASATVNFLFVPSLAGEVIGAHWNNATAASAASGTTTGSAASVVLYKNASNTGSRIATWNGSGTTVATYGTASMTITSSANARLAAGDVIIGEFLGGAADNASNAGSYIQVDFIYGRATGTTPSAGTGPA